VLGKANLRIIVFERHIEQPQTVVMTQVHKEQAVTFMGKEQLIISLVPHVHELSGNLE
jgi:hypothetical protein